MRGPARDERGFTIVEALVATAIVVLIGFTALAACRTVAGTLDSSNVARQGADALAEQTDRLSAEAATAFAVFVPPLDAAGRENAGQELDFYAQGGDGRPVFWRYVYDLGSQTLRRWDYDASGTTGVRDGATGAIDRAAAYPPITRVTRFAATPLAVSGLGDPVRNVYSGLAAFLTRPATAYAVRYAAAGALAPQAAGGNGIVQVSAANAAGAHVVHLMAGSMPAGFTVTGALVWHAIVYRVDQTHRLLGGLAGKSHVFIRARVEVSYDRWVTRTVWCDFGLLGSPYGLDAHDPHADYKPNEPFEQSPGILAACRQRHPLPPGRDGAAYPPDDDGAQPPPAPPATPEPRRRDQ